MRTAIVTRITQAKLIGIIRLSDRAKIEGILHTLFHAGIKVLEITSNTPQYAEEITKARKRLPDALIGAGTIINEDMAREAIQSGAQFLVSPNVNLNVILAAHQANIPVLTGALTPTEIATALIYKADIIKLFPAGTMGINYLKLIKGPFDTVPFFAVGGISDHNAAEWLNAGAAGIGIGGALTKGSLSEIKFLAEKLVKLVATEK
ncbi:bifunctional 4-hydroxy-2-oxoglutarate aldolase/2-dehydro-3-deoxy-phosphogluconate aldolase [Arenibacter sp. GZD96]|uniref:bifunctional 4-hydroxy-2-oxoglutarate aldolase/2-dehydro-3-deoxy-phosphogluconate aldolase n=1 Tax=Aurantibrevibacter litoralis TaxID=3106030 RepID=UPI002AFE275A|nr:bifunctional 4-hydroxy-2-oxoglutarate aldolase/2-dehydro-3-deoxy-phosphogluconate aldolase [Arenibacter sp. GZD-96]MEA1786253.1 bifunctional 4-hydroxy-2-oxoglutarate aldolase/2-dehydro-3-deoxy-phosphogluconate aldolase [Arenibacter sp. GZD-96]